MPQEDSSSPDPTEQGRSSECPLAPVHGRLQDAHRLWHQAAEEYSEPEGFRINLNACIQALRSVTWVLQKQKSKIPDFDAWYARWQERMKADPTMRWLVEARNQVVKEGDLKTQSVARVRVVANWLEAPVAEYAVDPLMPTPAIAANVKTSGLPEHVKEVGLVSVERRWVAGDLPEHELLDALAHAYGFLSTVVDDAHAQLGLPATELHKVMENGCLKPAGVSTQQLGGRLPCMVATEWNRTVWVKLATKEIVLLLPRRMRHDPEAAREVAARYGLEKPEGRDKEGERSLVETAAYYFEMARRIFSKDRYHGSIVLIGSSTGGRSVIRLDPSDTADKLMQWRHVAMQVEREGADWVVAVGEAWTAPFDEEHPERAASESPDRKELLYLDAASMTGEQVTYCAEIRRRGESVELEPTVRDDDRQLLYLEPIRRVWRNRTGKDGS